MVLIKSIQETDGRILNHVCIGENYLTRLKMSEYYLCSLKQKNNNN